MRDDRTTLRTTLDVDDDVLQVVKEMAELQQTTAGKVLSGLARKALSAPQVKRVRNGVPLLPKRPTNAPRPTMKLVNELRDDA